MITKTVTVGYSGSVENNDTINSNFMTLTWELDATGARTGNVIVRSAFNVGGDVQYVVEVYPSAALANAKFIAALNDARATLTIDLGL